MPIFNKFKKKNPDENMYPMARSGKQRQQDLLDEYDNKNLYLPYSISLEDIDLSVFNVIKEGDLKLVLEDEVDIDKNIPPVIYIANERWGEFEKTWKYVDENKNLVPPFITVTRTAEQRGTYVGGAFGSTPNRKKFTYLKVPTFENGYEGVDIYKIPIPTPIDCTYEVKLFSRYTVDMNRFVELYTYHFTDLHYYIQINGHYVSIKLQDNISKEIVQGIDSENINTTTATLLVKAYLQDKKDFEYIKGINKIVTVGEISNEKLFELRRDINPNKNI